MVGIAIYRIQSGLQGNYKGSKMAAAYSPFIHSRLLLSALHIPGSILGTGDSGVTKQSPNLIKLSVCRGGLGQEIRSKYLISHTDTGSTQV